jgi:CheY-like chemotaxis protein
MNSHDDPAKAPPIPDPVTILLVEDLDPLRKMLKLVLETNRYTVLEAENPQQALELSTNVPCRIDLLLTDVMMPGMTGCQLVEKLLQQRPEMKVLYVSGSSSEHLEAAGISGSGPPVLAKPFSLELLLKSVQTLLNPSTPNQRPGE